VGFGENVGWVRVRKINFRLRFFLIASYYVVSQSFTVQLVCNFPINGNSGASKDTTCDFI
jgi:hypothetical protein